jgi:hypothetical protein
VIKPILYRYSAASTAPFAAPSSVL